MGVWTEALPSDVTVEVNGAYVPLRDTQFVKDNANDLTQFVKKAYDAHREVGARIPVRVERVRNPDGTFALNENAIAAWRKDHLPKLYDAGILEKPPESPEAYQITRPESIPEGITWSDEIAKKFATVAHKYGIPKGAIPELLELHASTLGQIKEIVKTTEAEAEAELRREFPDYDKRLEDVKRLNRVLFKTQEEYDMFEEIHGNNPAYLGVLMRLAPLAAQDSSLGMAMNAVSGRTRESVQAELADIMQNAQNPRHKLYLSGDPTTLDYVDGLYKQLPGANEKITIA